MTLALYLLVMINPFSQILYMWDVMKVMDSREFALAYAYATFMSFGVFAIFALTGDFLFTRVFRVGQDAFQIFGGLVILIIALRYYTAGAGSNLLVAGRAIDLAPRISLPYMVGPGTIWVCILLGRSYDWLGLVLILAAVASNFVLVALLGRLITRLPKESALSKYLEVLMKTNALFIGAIGVEMIVGGLTRAITSNPRAVDLIS